MNLNINLFVHGVPMGQKIWGPNGEDRSYISSFYGPKWDAPEVMKIDIMTFGGVSYCYYSFVKGQNVYDSQGRAGSYFALTLRINAFYSDIQNLYAILKAAYDKICVGLCVQETNDSVRYLLSDFQNVDTRLKELEQRILDYISEFSVSGDIMELNGFSIHGKPSMRTFNLHECSKDVATKAIKQYGKLSISPWFLSESAVQTVKRYKEESIAASQKAQQEIDTQKKVSQQKIEEITIQLQNEIEAIKKQSSQELNQYKEKTRLQISQIQAENEHKIEEIKNRYVNVDLKIKSLKDSIKEKDKEISRLRQLSRPGVPYSSPIPPYGGTPLPRHRKKLMRIIIYCIVCVVLILLLLLICKLFLFPSNEIKSDDHDRKEVIIEKKVTQNNRPHIFIEEFTKGEKEAIVGKLYHISIAGIKKDDTKGVLRSDEFKIESNAIMAKRDYLGKKGTIYYVVDGVKKDSIEIQIKDSI